MPPDVVVVFETLYGSRACGLDEEGSDTDVRGIVVGPPAWYLGYRGGLEQIAVGKDHLRFEVRKFFRLAVRANPVALETLYTDPADHLVRTPAGDALLAARHLFLTRRIADTFGRFGDHQLRRIRARGRVDPKDGMHLVRLLRMGVEALREGTLRVRRPDRDELLAIKHGAWTDERLIAHAEELVAQLGTTATSLPGEPDEDALDALCVATVEAARG